MHTSSPSTQPSQQPQFATEIQEHVFGRGSKKRDVVIAHVKNNCYAYMNMVMTLCYLPEGRPIFYRGMDAYTRYRLTRSFVVSKLRQARDAVLERLQMEQ